jgi:ubiquinone/menaquinone biosynthesis C-methylase UbiE
MLHHTRRRLEAAGLRAAFVRADAQALPIHSATVDRVLLVTVLGEIPDRTSALVQILRVLRAGGLLCVSEQFPDPDFVTIATLRRELASAGFVEEETLGSLFYTSTWLKVTAPDAVPASRKT